jgi:hypothetical protein
MAFQAAASSSIEINLRNRLVDRRRADAAAVAQARLQRLQFFPLPGLAINARQQQQAACILFAAIVELFERCKRRIELLVFYQEFGLHDEDGRAPFAGFVERPR